MKPDSFKQISRVVFVLLVLFVGAMPARAHLGPPFPIMEKRQIGPLSVDVWSNPDVGTGSFFVILKPVPGGSVPEDIRVQVAVQPVSKRLPEVTYDAWRENLPDRIEYKTLVPFDREEQWKVRVLLSSKAVHGEADTEVRVTPTLLGRWNLLLLLLPFLGIGYLWLKAMAKQKTK